MSSIVFDTYCNLNFNIEVEYFKKLLSDLLPICTDIVDFWIFMFHKAV